MFKGEIYELIEDEEDAGKTEEEKPGRTEAKQTEESAEEWDVTFSFPDPFGVVTELNAVIN